jgi:cytochrome c oxidase subunit I+III
MVAAAALIVVALTLYWAIGGHYTARRHANVTNIARFWAAMVVIWVIGFATLYLGPRLT